jgi:hypothetical protein
MHTTESLSSVPSAVARDILHTLTGSLPPPATDTPEDRAARDEAAIAAAIALHPADAFEAMLATQIITANAHAMDCLREAAQPGQDADAVRRCRAQAAAMMRLMQSGLRTLKRDQTAREKAEAEMQPAAMERAGYWFRDVSVPARDEAPPQPAPIEPDIAAEAELYAVIYPRRAALIRGLGGLPAKLDFGPPEPELVAAIVAGTGPNLRALDAQARHQPAAAD